jgi:hypothetical protein
VKIASDKQIRRLYYLLYKKGLDSMDVKEAVENICRKLKLMTIGDITTDEIQKAYCLVDKINKFGELEEEK